LVAVVAALVDSIDGVASGIRGQVGYLVWYELAAFVPTVMALGAVLGVWFQVARSQRTRFSSPIWQSVWFGAPASLFVAWVPSSWILEHWGEMPLAARFVAVAWFPFSVAAVTAFTIGVLIALRRPGFGSPRRRRVVASMVASRTDLGARAKRSPRARGSRPRSLDRRSLSAQLDATLDAHAFDLPCPTAPT
jgi:hypothetical protein